MTGLVLGLLMTHGIPALSYRVSLAIYRAQQTATEGALQAQLADLNDTSKAFRMVAERVKPAVAHIRTTRYFGRPGTVDVDGEKASQPQQFYQEGHGTGVVVDPTGYVLTNYHVVAGASSFSVELPGRSDIFQADIQGTDPLSDMALLKIQAAGINFPAVTLGDSSQLAVGDWVLAVGSPYGLDQSVTAGIVSAVGRRGRVENLEFQDYIQTDAAINPGNSGGPLVNLRGDVVGIARFSAGNQGLGFAIPSNLARTAVEELRQYGRIRRGWLGLVMHPVDPQQALAKKLNTPAVEVDYVVPGSPAEMANVQPGDYVVAYQGASFLDQRELQQRILSTPPDTKVTLELHRQGEMLQARLTAAVQPAEPTNYPGEREWGVQLAALTPAYRRMLKAQYTAAMSHVPEEGVMVVGVDPRGPLGGKIQPGEVVVQIQERPVGSLAEFARIAKQLDLSKVTLHLMSPTGKHQVTLQ